MITQKSEPFVVVFKRNNRCFDTASTHPSPLVLHLLLYVILVIVSLFNIRFRKAFDDSAIWKMRRAESSLGKKRIGLHFETKGLKNRTAHPKWNQT